MNEKLGVIVKAAELMQYTMTVTSNRKRYPVKYVTLVKRMQNKTMDIYEFLMDANRLELNLSRDERLTLQRKAVTTCDKLSCFVEMSMNLNLINTNKLK